MGEVIAAAEASGFIEEDPFAAPPDLCQPYNDAESYEEFCNITSGFPPAPAPSIKGQRQPPASKPAPWNLCASAQSQGLLAVPVHAAMAFAPPRQTAPASSPPTIATPVDGLSNSKQKQSPASTAVRVNVSTPARRPGSLVLPPRKGSQKTPPPQDIAQANPLFTATPTAGPLTGEQTQFPAVAPIQPSLDIPAPRRGGLLLTSFAATIPETSPRKTASANPPYATTPDAPIKKGKEKMDRKRKNGFSPEEESPSRRPRKAVIPPPPPQVDTHTTIFSHFAIVRYGHVVGTLGLTRDGSSMRFITAGTNHALLLLPRPDLRSMKPLDGGQLRVFAGRNKYLFNWCHKDQAAEDIRKFKELLPEDPETQQSARSMMGTSSSGLSKGRKDSASSECKSSAGSAGTKSPAHPLRIVEPDITKYKDDRDFAPMRKHSDAEMLAEEEDIAILRDQWVRHGSETWPATMNFMQQWLHRRCRYLGTNDASAFDRACSNLTKPPLQQKVIKYFLWEKHELMQRSPYAADIKRI